MRYLTAAALALAVLLGMSPSWASQGRTTTRQHVAPVLKVKEVSGLTVVLQGAAGKHSRAAVLERRVRGHWHRIKQVRIHKHRFRLRVHQHRERVWYRARVGGHHSPGVRAQVKPPSDACGIQPTKSDTARWSCTFDDEFDGNQLDRTKWVPQETWSSGYVTGTDAVPACYVDDPRNISVSGGALHLTVRHVDKPVWCGLTLTKGNIVSSYLSGGVMTYGTFKQKYGRFQVRMRAQNTRVSGLQEDFWMWPRPQLTDILWPAAGEIDVAEQYSSHPDLMIPFLHYTANDNGGPIPDTNTAWDCTAARGVYNTYTLTWTPTKLTIDVNGKTCLVNDSGDSAFQKEYFMALTQALGGQSGNPLVVGTPLPATMDVDFVRVWK